MSEMNNIIKKIKLKWIADELDKHFQMWDGYVAEDSNGNPIKDGDWIEFEGEKYQIVFQSYGLGFKNEYGEWALPPITVTNKYTINLLDE